MAKSKKLPTYDDPVDITPLIDIVFLLIIFFLVVGKFVADQATFQVQVPVSSAADTQVEIRGKIVIQLKPTRDGAMASVNASAGFPLRELPLFLKNAAEAIRIREGKGENDLLDIPVLLRADRDTPYEFVKTVNDHCQELKLWNVKWKAKED